MKVSVALATYNGEKYLLEQLNSIKNQNYLPTELVINDDKSSDDTLSVIEYFSKTAPFTIRVCQNERNLGYSGNFNEAISMTSVILPKFKTIG